MKIYIDFDDVICETAKRFTELAETLFGIRLPLEELYRMDFDLAVEDSPAAFSHLTHFERCRVLVFDRPWNQTADFPNERFERCKDWKEIQERIEALRMS